MRSLSRVQRFANPWTIAYQAPPSMGFSKEVFPTQGLNPGLPHCRQMPYCLSYQGSCQSRRWGSVPGLRRFPGKREWQPTPVFLPGEPHGQRSLVGYSPQCHKESGATERLNNNGELSAQGTHTVPDG